MSSSTSQPSDPCASLDDFLVTLRGVSESPAFKNAEIFTSSFKQLAAKVKDQEETMMTTRDELMRAKQDSDGLNRRLLRTHREETHKIMNDMTELQNERDRLNTELTQERARSNGLHQEIKNLQQQMTEEAKQTQKLHDHIASLKQSNAKLESDLGKTNEALRTLGEEAREQKVKIKEQDKLRSDLEGKISGMSTSLREKSAAIKQIHNFAPVCVKDDITHLGQSMRRLWQALFEAATKCFDPDIAMTVLENQQSWKGLRENDMMPPDMPFPPSNTMAAKSIRTTAVMAVLAELLTRYIFTPSYLFFDDEEARTLSSHLATTEADREKFLRRVLNSTSKDKQVAVKEKRIESVLGQVNACVQPLLDEKVRESFGASVSQLLGDAIELWSGVQRMASLFETDVAFDTRVQWTWRAISWTKQGTGFSEREIKHEHLNSLDVCLVLFPRVFAVIDSVDQPVFPGIVLPQSETRAAKEEWDQIRQSKPMLGRASSSRSARPRRTTLNDSNGARWSFLDSRRL